MTEQSEVKAPEVRQHVIYCDSRGMDHDAIVTIVWPNMGGAGKPGVNLVYVSNDEARQDSYGRQIERATSVSHRSVMNVHGNYWRYTDEERNPYTPPQT
ncbi:MAG: hypothetical protein AB1631_28555 [Acidobacteriota bacterium]